MQSAGMIGLVQIRGWGGRLIALGQFLNGAKPRYAKWTHALIATGSGRVVQAEPNGAEFVAEEQATGGRKVVWFCPCGVNMNELNRAADYAITLVGTPYSWVDYFAIAAHRLGFSLLSKRLQNYVSSSKHMICSQLVDYAYQEARVQLFNDGRLPGNVTPADLARLAEHCGVRL